MASLAPSANGAKPTPPAAAGAAASQSAPLTNGMHRRTLGMARTGSPPQSSRRPRFDAEKSPSSEILRAVRQRSKSPEQLPAQQQAVPGSNPPKVGDAGAGTASYMQIVTRPTPQKAGRPLGSPTRKPDHTTEELPDPGAIPRPMAGASHPALCPDRGSSSSQTSLRSACYPPFRVYCPVLSKAGSSAKSAASGGSWSRNHSPRMASMRGSPRERSASPSETDPDAAGAPKVPPSVIAASTRSLSSRATMPRQKSLSPVRVRATQPPNSRHTLSSTMSMGIGCEARGGSSGSRCTATPASSPSSRGGATGLHHPMPHRANLAAPRPAWGVPPRPTAAGLGSSASRASLGDARQQLARKARARVTSPLRPQAAQLSPLPPAQDGQEEADPRRVSAEVHESSRYKLLDPKEVKEEEFAAEQNSADAEDARRRDECGRTPLMLAAGEGSEAGVEELLRQRADVDALDECRCTPLMYAATYGHLAIASLLIDSNAQVNSASKDGWTPLITAAYNGHAEMVRHLLTQGANVDAADERGWTSLMHVAFTGDNVTLMCLLENRADAAVRDVDSRTALVYAAFNGKLANVRCLLEAASDASCSAESQQVANDTALMFAAMHGHADIANLLLERKAVSMESRQSALKLAWDQGQQNVVEMLIRRTVESSPESIAPMSAA